MKKFAKILCTSMMILTLIWLFGILADRQQLSENVIRLHVVANSDSNTDQQIKLQVRDAVVQVLQQNMQLAENSKDAKNYLQQHLPLLEQTANAALTALGCTDRAVVTLEKETFPTRDYETFSLPAGVYESLRVTIGQGEGKNWWCVVFPSLCMPAAGEDMADTAAGAGFSEPLTDTLQQKDGYEVRFFLLDCLGWLQNLFF